MDDREGRRRAREGRSWTGTVRALGAGAADDPSAGTTAEERIALVWTLSGRMWELSGRPLPRYERSEIPVRVLRGR